MRRKAKLNRELDRTQARLPGWITRILVAVRHPSALWIRIPAAIALIVGGIFGFLPILGFWMLPLGLALLALDLPFLRRPLTRLMALINRKLPAQVS